MKITTSGYTFHIDTAGGTGMPCIFMLHGFLGSGKDWRHCADKLQSRYACFMPDLPGHGATTALDNAPHTFEDIAGQLAEAAIRIRTGPIHLVGYSMGGRLALYLALHYPDLFNSAVIVSSSPGLRTEEERARRRESDDRLAERLNDDFEGFLEEWYNMPLFESLRNHSLFPEILERRRENNPVALAPALRQLSTGRQPSLWDKLTENKLPTGFFMGEKDTKYVEIARQMVNLCPDSEQFIFPDCGHTLHIENRHLFLNRLTAFLQHIS